MEPVKLLENVVAEGQRIVDNIKPDQLGDPTPCEDFDVKALLNHLTMAAALITDGVHQQPMNPELFSKDFIGDDAAGSFRGISKGLLEAWNEPGVLDGTVIMPYGETPAVAGASFTCLELYAHISDAAIATRQEDALDPAVAQSVFDLVSAMPIDKFRMPGVFGPEVPCDEAAPAHRRMLALLGRQV